MQPSDKELPVVVIGTGALARQAMDTLVATGLPVYGYLALTRAEATAVEAVNDVPVLGAVADPAYQKLLKNEKLAYVLAVGDPAATRAQAEALFELTGRHPYTLVHPSASVAPSATLLAGCVVGPLAVVAANVEIGTGVAIGAGAVIEADARVGDYCQLAAGTRIGEAAQLEAEVLLALGATVAQGVGIGRGAKVGTGSVVVQPVAAGAAVFGVPAAAVQF